MPNVRREKISLDQIVLIENNPRTITEEDLRRLQNEIKSDPAFLLQRPPLLNATKGKLFCYAGSQRVKASMANGMTALEFFVEDDVPKEVQDRRMLLDNTHNGKWDFQILTDCFDFELDELKEIGIEGADDYLIDSETIGKEKQAAAKNALQNTFIAPPFSVLDTKQAYWQDRKRVWEEFGIKSQESREDVELMAKSAQNSEVYNLKNQMREALKREPSWDEVIEKAKQKGLKVFEGASIFDPVLCEIIYTWFTNKEDSILDPFAGGSVRGIVAGELGREYQGIDLRPEQVKSNVKQARDLELNRSVSWLVGDSDKVLDRIQNEDCEYDFIFSCPPYHDLEKYSEDESDLSNMEYETFKEVYKRIIVKSCSVLNQDRFACFVVSEIRDKRGFYKNFVKDTIEAFESADDVHFYNEIILLNQIASAAIRAGRQFNGGRKVTRVHQNVLVFYKGDPKKIKDNYPKLEAAIMDEPLA